MSLIFETEADMEAAAAHHQQGAHALVLLNGTHWVHDGMWWRHAADPPRRQIAELRQLLDNGFHQLTAQANTAAGPGRLHLRGMAAGVEWAMMVLDAMED